MINIDNFLFEIQILDCKSTEFTDTKSSPKKKQNTIIISTVMRIILYKLKKSLFILW